MVVDDYVIEIPLEYPIRDMDEEITSLKLRRPKWKELRDATKLEHESDISNYLVQKLSGLTQKGLDDIEPTAVTAAMEELQPFLVSPVKKKRSK